MKHSCEEIWRHGAAAFVAAALLSALALSAAVSAGGCESGTADAPAAEGFTIYLLREGIKTADLPTLSHLELSETPLISSADILFYSRDTHEMEVSGAAYEAVAELSVPVDGRPFAACIDGSPVYAGAFMTPFSSLGFDGVVILQALDAGDSPRRGLIRLELGYPDPSWFRGQDPRGDPAIVEALELSGKLR